MTRSRSPKAVLLEAYFAAMLALPKYAHRFSPRKFTQHQWLACLVLKDFYGLSYRGVWGLLPDSSDMREAIVWNKSRTSPTRPAPLHAEILS